jgi:hypothetical protein
MGRKVSKIWRWKFIREVFGKVSVKSVPGTQKCSGFWSLRPAQSGLDPFSRGSKVKRRWKPKWGRIFKLKMHFRNIKRLGRFNDGKKIAANLRIGLDKFPNLKVHRCHVFGDKMFQNDLKCPRHLFSSY